MPNFSKTLGTFFRSTNPKYSEFLEVLKENDFHQDWTEAVNLYRKGVLALQKNDITGVEIIEKANESLKRIISLKPTDNLKVNLQAFNESVVMLKESKDVKFVKFNFGILYESCKAAGFKSLLNEDTFYEDEGDGSAGDTNGDGNSEVIDETSVSTDATSTEITEPAPIEQQLPETPKSSYKEGFEAGAAYVEQCASMKETKFGHSKTVNDAIKEAITTHLHTRPYNEVKKWEEGFKRGALHQEEIHKEIYADDYKNYISQTNQEPV